MKYIIIVPDGMADKKIEELGDRTPMEYADLSAMDSLELPGPFL